MQSLIRSKSAGVTGGRGTAGARPGRDLLYGSRGVPAAPTYGRPGDLGPYEPRPSTLRVRIVDSVETTPEIGAREEPRRSGAWRTPEVEARREVRRSGRGGLDTEDLVSIGERRCRKACNVRSAAEDSEETCHSGSSGGRARRYRKRGSPKPVAGDAAAMDTDPSPVRLWDSEGHFEGYLTAYEQPLESEETARPPTRANTAPEPSLEHDAEALERPARARTAPVARHTEPTRDSMGDTPMAEESEAPGTAGCAGSGGKHAECHCEHVSFLMGKCQRMGMDAIVHRLDRLDNAKDGQEEDVAGILDDLLAAERDMAELRAERDRYQENLDPSGYHKLPKARRLGESPHGSFLGRTMSISIRRESRVVQPNKLLLKGSGVKAVFSRALFPRRPYMRESSCSVGGGVNSSNHQFPRQTDRGQEHRRPPFDCKCVCESVGSHWD